MFHALLRHIVTDFHFSWRETSPHERGFLFFKKAFNSTMAKKAKARVILVKLLSSAGTGYNYIKSRPRISPKLSMMKYDPMGKKAKTINS